MHARHVPGNLKRANGACFPRQRPSEGVAICYHAYMVRAFVRSNLRWDRFGLVLISTCLSALCLEGVCRLTNIGSPRTARMKEDQVITATYAYQPNSQLVYHYPDNRRGYFDEHNTVVGTINAKGFRGPDVPFKKPNGVVRLAFLGDSFTLGIGVRDDDTLPAWVERTLRIENGKIQALNFGVSGTSTHRQVELLRQYVTEFDPDIVVLVIFLNDPYLGGTMRYMSRPRIFKKVRQHTFALNALLRSIEGPFMHRKMIHEYREGYVEGSPGWESMKSALRDAKSLAEESGFQLVFAVYPVLFQLNDRYPFKSVHETLVNFATSLDVPCCDLLTAFQGRQDAELWVHPADRHPNEEAHRLAAAEFVGWLSKQSSIKKLLQ